MIRSRVPRRTERDRVRRRVRKRVGKRVGKRFGLCSWREIEADVCTEIEFLAEVGFDIMVN